VVERIAYLAELAGRAARRHRHLILVDAKAPVSFFAYPGKKSDLVPDSCTVHTLATPEQDAAGSLQSWRAPWVPSKPSPPCRPGQPPGPPARQADRRKGVQGRGPPAARQRHRHRRGHHLGPDAAAKFTAGAPRHDLITLTGGAIGQGLPNAVGAAIACPDRPVLALIGDGTAMYTIQALWTMAREKLNVTIIFNNASYSVLNIELERVGADESAVGAKARSQLDLAGPVIHFADLGR
jgi:acetolactate synthase-1/2/3 large subunit